MKHARTIATAAALLIMASCSTDDGGETAADDTTAEDTNPEDTDAADGDDTTEEEPATTEQPEEPEVDEEVAEEVEEEGDIAGEEPGVILLAEPFTWSDAGLELEVDAVRILSVDEMTEMTDEDISEYLEDSQATTLVGLRATLRNTTETELDWYAAGAGSVIILEGQQGGPFLLGDWGDTIRPGAELEINAYYESRVDVEEARSAGLVRWDLGEAFDTETYETIVDPGEVEITYTAP